MDLKIVNTTLIRGNSELKNIQTLGASILRVPLTFIPVMARLRMDNAFTAMRALGISPKTVAPVLKELLRVYDNNWELIEAENYRVLADTIFDKEDVKLGHDGPEPPSKKLCSGKQDNEKAKDPILPLDKIPFTSSQNSIDISQPCTRDRRIGSSSHLHYEQYDDRAKNPISSHVSPRDKKSYPGKASHAMHVKEPRDESCSVSMWTETVAIDNRKEKFIKPKTKHLSNDASLPHYAGPASKVHSDSLAVSSTGKSSTSASQNTNSDKKEGGSTCICCTSCKTTFDIASSISGEVKISVNCKPAVGLPNFSIPNLDAVIKSVENTYLRLYKIVGPQFSVKKLLKDLCLSYFEMGTATTNRSVIAKASPSSSTKGPNKGDFGISSSEKNASKNKSSCSGSSKSSSLASLQQQDRRHPIRINDITNGLEKMEIALVDETRNEPVPKFFYISQNTVYQDAYVPMSLARIADEDCCSSCLGDCLSSSIPCACARETGGEFAYTSQGLLKEEFLTACISMNRDPQDHHFFFCQEDCPLERCKNEFMPGPCKGHLVRKFIKECWRKCGCHLRCGNRVVQRGITCHLQVFFTHGGKGWGLRSLQELRKGAFVCEYVGEILTNTELDERNQQSSGNERHFYPVLLDADWGSEGILKDEEALCLDATFYGNVARFINHRCYDANLIEIPVEVETPDHHYYHIAFFTNREVRAMEELTWDYGIDFSDHNHPVKAFQCCCGGPYCRGRNREGHTNMQRGNDQSAENLYP